MNRKTMWSDLGQVRLVFTRKRETESSWILTSRQPHRAVPGHEERQTDRQTETETDPEREREREMLTLYLDFQSSPQVESLLLFLQCLNTQNSSLRQPKKQLGEKNVATVLTTLHRGGYLTMSQLIEKSGHASHEVVIVFFYLAT